MLRLKFCLFRKHKQYNKDRNISNEKKKCAKKNVYVCIYIYIYIYKKKENRKKKKTRREEENEDI